MYCILNKINILNQIILEYLKELCKNFQIESDYKYKKSFEAE